MPLDSTGGKQKPPIKNLKLFDGNSFYDPHDKAVYARFWDGIIDYEKNPQLNDINAEIHICGGDVYANGFPKPDEKLGEYESIHHDGQRFYIKNLKFFHLTSKGGFLYFIQIYHRKDLICSTRYFRTRSRKFQSGKSCGKKPRNRGYDLSCRQVNAILTDSSNYSSGDDIKTQNCESSNNDNCCSISNYSSYSSTVGESNVIFSQHSDSSEYDREAYGLGMDADNVDVYKYATSSNNNSYHPSSSISVVQEDLPQKPVRLPNLNLDLNGIDYQCSSIQYNTTNGDLDISNFLNSFPTHSSTVLMQSNESRKRSRDWNVEDPLEPPSKRQNQSDTNEMNSLTDCEVSELIGIFDNLS
eukprot:gb/GECH01014332.1/.p1 GENE.gb/GECH01014332.1/~~gb/GECH01014332.1/.p1  ORF type:complete len:356 (+),score=41.93 gb/GECH01014332.1/:1-1068(+)